MEDFTLRDKRLTGFTYVMSNELGLVKIGQSINPEERRKTIESASGLPVKLELIVRGSFKEEMAHELLKQYSTVGEWFNCPPDKAVEVLQELEKLNDEAIYGQMLNYTKKELEEVFKVRLEELVSFAGSYIYLAKMLNIPTSTVQGWVTRGRISKRGALLVDKHKDLTKSFSSKYLRPDL